METVLGLCFSTSLLSQVLTAKGYHHSKFGILGKTRATHFVMRDPVLENRTAEIHPAPCHAIHTETRKRK
jgi:hypothetical protein